MSTSKFVWKEIIICCYLQWALSFQGFLTRFVPLSFPSSWTVSSNCSFVQFRYDEHIGIWSGFFWAIVRFFFVYFHSCYLIELEIFVKSSSFFFFFLGNMISNCSLSYLSMNLVLSCSWSMTWNNFFVTSIVIVLPVEQNNCWTKSNKWMFLILLVDVINWVFFFSEINLTSKLSLAFFFSK